MAIPFIREKGLTFDLTGLTVPDFSARVAWAIRTGLAASTKGHAIARLISVLVAGRTRTVAFYTSLQTMGASLPPETSAAGLAIWTDGRSGQICGFEGPPEQRIGLKIYLAPSPYLQSALEYTWHELLHLTVPFTHTQSASVGVGAVPGGDNGRWYPLIAQIGHELPPEGVDPITGQHVRFQQPFATLGCQCGTPV